MCDYVLLGRTRQRPVFGGNVIGLLAAAEPLPHLVEQRLQALGVLLAVEEGALAARHPHLGPYRPQVLLVRAQLDGNVLVLLAAARNQLRTAERGQLRGSHSVRRNLILLVWGFFRLVD